MSTYSHMITVGRQLKCAVHYVSSNFPHMDVISIQTRCMHITNTTTGIIRHSITIRTATDIL
jgi:hypothetical protein